MATIIISEDQFDDLYQPIPNHFNDSWFYETYGEELDYILTLANEGTNTVWNYQDDDNGVPCLTSGYHLVNRIGYVVTHIPYKSDDDIYVKLEGFDNDEV